MAGRNPAGAARLVGAPVTTEAMVALLGESFLIQAYIIRRAPALRKPFGPRLPVNMAFWKYEGAPTPRRWRARRCLLHFRIEQRVLLLAVHVGLGDEVR